jgi:hypothetical protein
MTKSRSRGQDVTPAFDSSGVSGPKGIAPAGALSALMDSVRSAWLRLTAADLFDAAPAARGVGNGSDMNATTMFVTPMPQYAVGFKVLTR